MVAARTFVLLIKVVLQVIRCAGAHLMAVIIGLHNMTRAKRKAGFP